MTFKEKLIRLRKINSLTQDEFACAVGVSRQAVYKWESGQSYPEVAKLLEIKLLFGISIDDLLDDTYDIPLPQKKRKKRMSKAEKERIEALVNEEFSPAEDAEEEPSEEAEEVPAAEEEAAEAEAVAEDMESHAEEAPAPEETPAPEAAPTAEAASEEPKKRGLFGLFSKR